MEKPKSIKDVLPTVEKGMAPPPGTISKEQHLEPSSEAKEAKPQVAQQLDVLERRIIDLNNMVAGMEKRLSAVSKTYAVPDNKAEPMPDLVPVARSIRQQADRLAVAIIRIGHLMENLEV